jgi:hypothetical protein
MRAKTFLVLLAGLLLAGCVTAQTFTNGIKASQLGTAATFNGTENLFMWQVVSGTNRTAWATINQVLAPAISQNGATSNALNAAGIITSNRVTVASNFLASAIGTNAAAIAATSNSLALISGTAANAITNATKGTPALTAQSPSGVQKLVLDDSGNDSFIGNSVDYLELEQFHKTCSFTWA